MINQWNEICQHLNEADLKLISFIDSAGLNKLQLNKLNKFSDHYKKLRTKLAQFDAYLAPIDPIKVDSPFDQEDFRFIWKTWKDYCLEQHGRHIRSRMEKISLEYLAEISDNNPDLAIYYLRYAMANGYKSFFKVDPADKSTPPKPDKNGSDF